MSRKDKAIKFAQEIYTIPELRRYLLNAEEIDRHKVEDILALYLNFNNNSAFQEIIDNIILIAETDRVFRKK